MFSYLRSLLYRVFPRFRPRRIPYSIQDDKIQECVDWISSRPHGKHYVLCRLMSTVSLMKEMFPEATVMTVQHAVGWRSDDPNAYLCCTSSLRKNSSLLIQIRARLRRASKSHVLTFERN